MAIRTRRLGGDESLLQLFVMKVRAFTNHITAADEEVVNVFMWTIMTPKRLSSWVEAGLLNGRGSLPTRASSALLE